MERCELEAMAAQERHTLHHWRVLRAAAQRKGDAQDLAWCEQRIAEIERLLAQLALVLDPRPTETAERERPDPEDERNFDAEGRPLGDAMGRG